MFLVLNSPSVHNAAAVTRLLAGAGVVGNSITPISDGRVTTRCTHFLRQAMQMQAEQFCGTLVQSLRIAYIHSQLMQLMRSHMLSSTLPCYGDSCPIITGTC